MRRSDFLTRKERLRIKWSNLKFFVYMIFHKVSKFQNWEVAETTVLRPRKKKMIISGNLIRKGGKIIIKGDKNE